MGNKNTSSKPFKKEDVFIYQQKNHICKIYIYLNNLLSGLANGFFCLIPYPDENHLIHALITTYRTINETFIKQNKEIKLTLNNDSEKRTIKIDDNRKIYMNKDYDTTIIEIKPEIDKINYFLELDSYLSKENCGEIYNKTKIYLICYGKENKTESYCGDIINIEKEKLYHISDTASGSGGCPILSLSSFNVIGMHLGRTPKEYKAGILLKFPLEEFMKGEHFINISS